MTMLLPLFILVGFIADYFVNAIAVMTPTY